METISHQSNHYSSKSQDPISATPISTAAIPAILERVMDSPKKMTDKRNVNAGYVVDRAMVVPASPDFNA